MKIPGYTAEASLDRTSGQYHYTTIRGDSMGRREVIAQLRGSVFHRPRGGTVFGGIGDYWVCRDACARTRSACLETCEGTWENPKGSTNCIICNDEYNACLQGCTRDIA